MKNDNVQSSNTRWEETIIAMEKQLEEEILENCIIGIFNSQNSWSRCCRCAFKLLFKQQISDKHFFSRQTQLKQPASGAAAGAKKR